MFICGCKVTAYAHQERREKYEVKERNQKKTNVELE
jgi:hypothetical protein